jgi:hypothetical protein
VRTWLDTERLHQNKVYRAGVRHPNLLLVKPTRPKRYTIIITTQTYLIDGSQP